MSNENCEQCKVQRIPKRGIKVTNCLNAKNYWFCGFPCLLDYFSDVDNKAVSQVTQLMNHFGFEPTKTLEEENDK